ncbi:calcium-binding protein, partial [Pasteurellaceae bacterium LIM206]|nr:calcium-binding protein [Pasteurellaceae bacterium LIM206]
MSDLPRIIINAVASRTTTVDGVVETGMNISGCGKDKYDVTASVITAGSGIAGAITDVLGVAGARFSAVANTANLIKTVINTGNLSKISMSDIYTILGGVAGALVGVVGTPLGMTALTATLSVGGLVLTINDLLGSKKSGNQSGSCNKRKSSPSLGDIVPPNCTPDTSPAQDIPLSCPLIIDMDGNGIKTISLNKNVFFDLDNNLFAENTGWIDKGDAFLVWDRDNNGIIDSGNELFGNHTLLANGQKAANGFTALAELDANKDGLFDSNDEAWAKLQLWFDRNQNGISEEGELMKLSESGIKGIDLTYQNSKQTDENGNEHREHSSVTWNDGRTTDITDVWFKTDNARSYYKEQVEIPDEIKAMPNIIAFGNLLDLHTAMTKSPTLKYVIQEYIDASAEDKKELLNHLIYEWAETANIDPNSRGGEIDARKLATLEKLTGQDFKQRGSSSNPVRDAVRLLNIEFDKFARYVSAQLDSKTLYKSAFAITGFIINSENGELEFDWENLNSTITRLTQENRLIEAKRIISIARDLGIYNEDYYTVINKNLSTLSENNPMITYLIDNSFTEISLIQNNINGDSKNNLLLGNDDNNVLNGDDGNDILFGGTGNDQLNGGLDEDTYIFSKDHGQDTIREGDITTNRNDEDAIRFLDIAYEDVKLRRIGDDLLLFGYHKNDSVTIKKFYAEKKYRIENFQFSNRTFTYQQLLNQQGIEILGTKNNDVLSAGTGDDTLIGGAGNDKLEGGFGDDTYVFSKGHGQDIVYEGWDWGHDINTLVFKDVNYSEVKFRQVGDDLILYGYHEDDSVTINRFYQHVRYQFDRLVFADRTLTRDELRTEGITLFGTEGDDTITSLGDKTTVDAGAGDDTIRTGSSDDTLIGGAGNDKLEGGFGD